MNPTPNQNGSPEKEQGVCMPRPTAAPIVIAFGVMLMSSGLVLNFTFTVIGLVVFVVGLTKWIYILASDGGEELAPIEARPTPIKVSKVPIQPLRPGMPGHRMKIPEKVHPYSAGLKGGIVGGVAMAAVALTYGAVSGRGLWYPVNLLAGMIMPMSPDNLSTFSLLALILGFVIFVVTALGVGLMFGILLPTMPRFPVFWGGIVAPLLWTAAIYSFMEILNPVLNEHVDWLWFFASQFAYGIAVGLVVIRSEKVSVAGAKS